ncbi:MAG: hypothetical protein R6X17_06540 [Candidatus Competibacteraceae bacterium]
MTDQYAVADSDWSDRWPQRIAMLARVVRGLDPAGSLDPDAWLQTLTLARLLERLSNESGAAVALRTAIRDYLEQLPGHAEGDGRRMRLHHEVTRLLLAGGVEPLTAAEIEELGLTPWDEVEEG